MSDEGLGRRDFLKGVVAGGGAAAATAAAIPHEAAAQPAQPASPGYEHLNLDEAAFVEALVDHMVPADELTPKGTDIGINIYIDRALARRLGQGRSPLYAGAVEARRAEPGLPVAAHARAALSRRHRGDQRAIAARPTANLRRTRREAARGGAGRAVVREDHLRGRTAGARVLDHGLSDRDGGHVLRSDLRRQSRQGGLEADRLPRRDRRQSGEHREVQGQAVSATILSASRT